MELEGPSQEFYVAFKTAVAPLAVWWLRPC